jgi:hemoglobin
MEKQKNKQKAFLMMAFGGPSQYSGKNLRDGHAHLVEKGLDDSHFDAVAENLVKTLNELNVPEGLIAQVLAIVGPTRDDVLGRGVTV